MRETILNLWRIEDMFGLDQLFDLDKNGKLDTFERASEMAFLSSAEEESRKPGRKSGRSYGGRIRSDDDDSGKDDSE
jgi:hypothetical protein